jgi:hypothetical protein
MKFARRLLLAALLGAAGVPTAAQTQETLRFTNAGNVTGFGYYVGPYQGMVLSQPGSPLIDLFCVDFLHGIALGQVWTANISRLSGDLSATRGGNAAYDLYMRTAWLASQYTVAPRAEWKNIQATIWNQFASSAPDPTNGAYWTNLAIANAALVNPSYWHIVTAVDMSDPNSAQEFLTYLTPEPSTYLLLGTGMMFLVFVIIRRRSSPLQA